MPHRPPPKQPQTQSIHSQRFDAEAPRYDQRTGLPAGVAQQVAVAVVQAWQNISGRKERPQLLEIAAGTGEMGQALSQLSRYTALEASAAMWEQAQQLSYSADAECHLADANLVWPIAKLSQDICFIARAAHLLDRAHLLAELQRCIAKPYGVLVLGRVQKDPHSPAQVLRRSLQQMLHDQGERPRRGERAQREIPNLLDSHAEHIHVAQWNVAESPAQVLNRWRSKPGLAGLLLSDSEQIQTLQQLEQLARNEFTDLNQIYPCQRSYVLSVARVHSDPLGTARS